MTCNDYRVSFPKHCFVGESLAEREAFGWLKIKLNRGRKKWIRNRKKLDKIAPAKNARYTFVLLVDQLVFRGSRKKIVRVSPTSKYFGGFGSISSSRVGEFGGGSMFKSMP